MIEEFVMQFSVVETNGPLIMDVCKFASYADSNMTKEKIGECFKGKLQESYVYRAIRAAVQLRLLDEKNGTFSCSQRWRDEIKKASRDELQLPFRQALQDYPPFLVYADLLSKGYISNEAAQATKGLFSIDSSPTTIERSLRLWGIYSGTIKQDSQTSKLALTIDTNRLATKYVEDLLTSLASDFRSKLFVIDRLTNELFTYLTEKNISIQDLVDALREYENKPDESVFNASKLFEQYLYKLGEDNHVPVTRCLGIIQLIEALRNNNPPLLLGNQRNVCFGAGGIRNISDHGVDRETGKPWKINPDTALVSVLMIPIVMRSVYLYNTKSAQEF
jgi:hypothetical protein